MKTTVIVRIKTGLFAPAALIKIEQAIILIAYYLDNIASGANSALTQCSENKLCNNASPDGHREENVPALVARRQQAER